MLRRTEHQAGLHAGKTKMKRKHLRFFPLFQQTRHVHTSSTSSVPFSVLEEWCWACGLPLSWPRSRSREATVTSCDACRTKNLQSHLTLNPRYSESLRAVPIFGASLQSTEVSIELHVRSDHNVPQALLEGRPRRRRVPQFPAHDPLFISFSRPKFSNSRPPIRRGTIPGPGRNSSSNKFEGSLPFISSKTPSPEIPQSPKLHHRHGLLKAKDYPYVHKREVAQHLITVRAGAPSPISSLHIELEKDSTVPYTPGAPNWSDTVYYSHSGLPVPARLPRAFTPEEWRPPTRSTQRPSEPPPGRLLQDTRQRPSPRLNTGMPFWPALPPNATLQIVEAYSSVAVRPGPTAVVEGEVGRSIVHTLRSSRSRHTPSLRYREITGSSSSDESHFSAGKMPLTPNNVSDSYLEVCGRCGSPNIRGGGYDECFGSVALSTSYSEKCSRAGGSCGSNRRRERGGTPPVPIVTPERAARESYNTMRFPLLRGLFGRRLGKIHNDLEEPTSHDSVTSVTILASPDPSSSPNTTHQHSQIRDQNIIGLRGGGPNLSDESHVPRTLWYLAGGRGRPSTVASWKKQKPSKRTSGLLGMVLYGLKAGTPYKSEENCGDSTERAKPISPEERVSFIIPSSSSSSSSSGSSNPLGGVSRSASQKQGGFMTANPDYAGPPSGCNVPKDSPPPADETLGSHALGLSTLPAYGDAATPGTTNTRDAPISASTGASTSSPDATGFPPVESNKTNDATNSASRPGDNSVWGHLLSKLDPADRDAQTNATCSSEGMHEGHPQAEETSSAVKATPESAPRQGDSADNGTESLQPNIAGDNTPLSDDFPAADGLDVDIPAANRSTDTNLTSIKEAEPAPQKDTTAANESTQTVNDSPTGSQSENEAAPVRDSIPSTHDTAINAHQQNAGDAKLTGTSSIAQTDTDTFENATGPDATSVNTTQSPQFSPENDSHSKQAEEADAASNDKVVPGYRRQRRKRGITKSSTKTASRAHAA
jgi:hypothetical protein